MARAPLLQLSAVSLTFGGNPVFDGLDLVVQPGDRVALVGRNGSGKSTLMKVMAGLVHPDRGQRAVPAGVSVGYMEQDPDLSGFATLGDFSAAGLAAGEGWRVAAAAGGLGFDPDTPVATASGGERRRAALARLMAQAPDLMLLDEPTNHLDIDAIEWLEAQLQGTRAAFLMISHDRAVLSALTRATLWIDRGRVRRREAGFAGFEDWRDELWAEEDATRHKLDRRIAAEARWAVEGISARRKRNMGRVRALAAMRADRAAQVRRQGTAALALEAGATSGARVIEARGLTHAWDGRVVCRALDLRVMRGDRVAFVGPNGAGKTTLLNLLTGRLAPQAGEVRLGTGVTLAVFDQARAALDPEASLWDSLTGDPALGVRGQGDQVMVRGAPRHVAGYLGDFLFDDRQFRAPVKSLSGGEKARLLLARIMARESNLLVLDEPTNDLDLETLDLMQDVLGDYPGTVLFVSHDRDFIDRVATQTVVLEGAGRVSVWPGGWSDWAAQRPAPPTAPAQAPRSRPDPVPARPPDDPGKPSQGLTFTEKKRLSDLPALIARLEAEIGRLTDLLSDPDLYARDPAKFARASDLLAERQAALSAAEDDWLELSERADA